MFNVGRNRMFGLDAAAILFGTASWISINGLWVELPLMVPFLPEGWTLASYLSAIVQIANLGPITYSIYQGLRPNHSKRNIIYVLMAIGTLSSMFLALFWDRTASVFGSETSLALFVLVFFLSLVDCTSSVLFLPFMAIFRETYLNSYLIGEGMSGFIPAIVALIQGVGGNPYCGNVTLDNGTIVEEAIYPQARFDATVFFYFLMSMMIVSTAAFLALNLVPKFKTEYVSVTPRQAGYRSTADNNGDDDEYSRQQQIQQSHQSKQQEAVQQQKHQEASAGNVHVPVDDDRELVDVEQTASEIARFKNRRKFAILLALQAYLSFVSNGAFPSITTYSCLPYGNVVYHLAATLHSMANPLMAFAAFFFPTKSLGHMLLHAGVGTVFAAYILCTALYSPEMLLGQDLGGTLTVISWVVYGGMFSYIKISIAGWCRTQTGHELFWYGVFTQIGSSLGAFSFFILINIAKIFQAYYIDCGTGGDW